MKEAKVRGKRRRIKWVVGWVTEVGYVGNTWRGLLQMGRAGAGAEPKKAGGPAHEKKDKRQVKWGQVLYTPQRQRWAGWAASDTPALGPGGAKVAERAGTRTRRVLCLGGRGAGRRL